jgi:hypothetical protein
VNPAASCIGPTGRTRCHEIDPFTVDIDEDLARAVYLQMDQPPVVPTAEKSSFRIGSKRQASAVMHTESRHRRRRFPRLHELDSTTLTALERRATRPLTSRERHRAVTQRKSRMETRNVPRERDNGSLRHPTGPKQFDQRRWRVHESVLQ